ncbi:hypothetical protein P3T73_07295 [Kiritimatiellota bacterium B12222]|nr:hypothetical protein P3T73_07295 [Kiritimatiellota bacterium B12222]
MNVNKRIYISLGAYVLLVIAAVTVPRFAAHGQDGLAEVAVAVVWFLLLGFLAVLTSLVSLVTVARAWKRLSPQHRGAGLAPAILSAVAILSLIVFLNHKGSEAAAIDTRPTHVTSPAKPK